MAEGKSKKMIEERMMMVGVQLLYSFISCHSQQDYD